VIRRRREPSCVASLPGSLLYDFVAQYSLRLKPGRTFVSKGIIRVLSSHLDYAREYPEVEFDKTIDKKQRDYIIHFFTSRSSRSISAMKVRKWKEIFIQFDLRSISEIFFIEKYLDRHVKHGTWTPTFAKLREILKFLAQLLLVKR